MRVLLTGHLGYIGTLMTPILLRAGHEVNGFDSGLYDGCTFKEGGDILSIPYARKDIRDAALADLKGFDAVIHLAGLSNDPLGDLAPDLTHDVNVRGTIHMAQLAKQAGVARFLFSSSCSNYGAHGDQWLDEESAFHPVTPYGRSKVQAEQELQALAGPRFSPTSLRSGTAYGVSPRLRFDLVLNNLVAWAVATGRVLLKSDGTPWRPLVHVEDICRTFLAVLEAPRERVHNRAFNVGRTNQNFQMRDLARIVAQTVPGTRIEFAADAGPDKRCYRVSFERLRETFPDLVQAWTVQRGAQMLFHAIRKASLKPEDFEGPRFNRVAHIKHLLAKGHLADDLRPVTSTGSKSPVADGFEERCRQATCRSCAAQGLQPVLNLGQMPLADGLVKASDLNRHEPRFPLELAFCSECTLVQILETVPPTMLFGEDYPYYSSFSDSLLRYSRDNARQLKEQRALTNEHLVVELASNDGYLLKNFLEWGIPVLGIDPARGPVQAARENGIPTLKAYFDRNLALRLKHKGIRPHVIIANNVLAHVADTNGFVAGIKTLLHEQGVAAIEVPYVRDLIDQAEFDTIYHEHLCYFSVTSVDRLMRRHGLFVNDVRRLAIHGGSLRLYVEHNYAPTLSVRSLLEEERRIGLDQLSYYRAFRERVLKLRASMRNLIHELKANGKSIAAYGAAAKGAIMLNFLDLESGSIQYVVDRNIHKQGKYMPGLRLPIRAPEELLRNRPDYVLILPWNFQDEIMEQQARYRAAGGRFIVPVPKPTVV